MTRGAPHPTRPTTPHAPSSLTSSSVSALASTSAATWTKTRTRTMKGTWKHATTLLSTGGEVTRVWHLEPPGPGGLGPDEAESATSVVLRHFPLTDERMLTVNGVMQEGMEFDVRVGGGRVARARVVVEPQAHWLMARSGLAGFTYACYVDGVRVRENNERAADAVDARQIAAEADVRIDARIIVAGDGVAWYRLLRRRAEVPSSGRDARPRVVHPVDVHRRFASFHLLYAQLCSAFRGHHLYASVPTPPPKEIPGLADHTSAAFLNERRIGLETWLRKVLALPGVAGGVNPDVQEFLGLGGPRGVREVSLAFFGPTLGIRLMKPPLPAVDPNDPDPAATMAAATTFSAQVVDVSGLETADPYPSTVGAGGGRGGEDRVGDGDGEPLPTPPAPANQAGDMITRIGGESALLIGYDAVIAMLRAAPRPLVVHFLGVRDGEAAMRAEPPRPLPPVPPPRSSVPSSSAAAAAAPTPPHRSTAALRAVTDAMGEMEDVMDP